MSAKFTAARQIQAALVRVAHSLREVEARRLLRDVEAVVDLVPNLLDVLAEASAVGGER